MDKAQLILKRGGVETEEVITFGSPAIVGRFDPSVGPIDIDLGQFPEGQTVSRKHAKITLEDGVWTLQDLGSSNGTFVLRDEFEKIESCELNDADQVAFGNACFIFRISAPEDAAELADEPAEDEEIVTEQDVPVLES